MPNCIDNPNDHPATASYHLINNLVRLVYNARQRVRLWGYPGSKPPSCTHQAPLGRLDDANFRPCSPFPIFIVRVCKSTNDLVRPVEPLSLTRSFRTWPGDTSRDQGGLGDSGKEGHWISADVGVPIASFRVRLSSTISKQDRISAIARPPPGPPCYLFAMTEGQIWAVTWAR